MGKKLFLAWSFFALSLFANEEPDWGPTPIGRWCAGIELSADFLFWKPCGTEFDYAAHLIYPIGPGDFDNPTAEFKQFHFDWTPGVRANVSFFSLVNCLDLELGYTYLADTAEKHFDTCSGFVVSPLIHPAIVNQVVDVSEATPLTLPFNRARTQGHFAYHKWDALISGVATLSPSCCEIVYRFGGTGLILNQHHRTHYFATTVAPLSMDHEWESQLWGVGANVGFQFNYYSSCAGKTFLRLNGLLLAAENIGSTTHRYEEESVSEWAFREPRARFTIPGLELAAGIEYGLPIRTRQLVTLRVGYQFSEYWNIPTPRGMTGWLEGDLIGLSPPVNIGNFGFHGLFVGANAGF